MKSLKLFCLVIALVLVVGCSIVTPSDRLVIHDHYLNAVAINTKVQNDATLPDYVRQWWQEEERTWTAFDAWSKGEKFPEPEVIPVK